MSLSALDAQGLHPLPAANCPTAGNIDERDSPNVTVAREDSEVEAQRVAVRILMARAAELAADHTLGINMAACCASNLCKSPSAASMSDAFERSSKS